MFVTDKQFVSFKISPQFQILRHVLQMQEQIPDEEQD